MLSLYMMPLQDQAPMHNSSLVLLTGNHELFNMRGDYRLDSWFSTTVSIMLHQEVLHDVLLVLEGSL